MELRPEAVWDAATVHVWRADTDSSQTHANKTRSAREKVGLLRLRFEHTFEPRKALCRRRCISAAGQGDGPSLCHLSCWEDCYGGEVGSVCRPAEKNMTGGDKTHTTRVKLSPSICTHTPAPGRQEGTGPSVVGWADRYTRQRVGGRSD